MRYQNIHCTLYNISQNAAFLKVTLARSQSNSKINKKKPLNIAIVFQMSFTATIMNHLANGDYKYIPVHQSNPMASHHESSMPCINTCHSHAHYRQQFTNFVIKIFKISDMYKKMSIFEINIENASK